MVIQKIYDRFSISDGLQRHMLTVAAVGKYIIDHWQGLALDGLSVTAALLLHDLGNLVKFDLSENARVIEPALFTDEWRERQRIMREKYGAHSHQATQAILRELGVTKSVQTLANAMDADDLCVFPDMPFEYQICEYADLRVAPSGVVSMPERLADFRQRYSHYDGWSNEEKYQRNIECAERLETNLQQHVSVDISRIPPEKIQAYLVELSRFAIDRDDAKGV